MNKRSRMMLRVFINRFHAKTRDDFIRLLPPIERKEVFDEEILSGDLAPILRQPQEALKRIHYSWIGETLKTLPAPFQSTAAASLTREQMTGLRLNGVIPIAASIKSFMQKQIYDALRLDDHVPPEYLPETELSPLLYWTKEHLMSLIDFLGINDLASAVRHIVNRDHLKSIYTCLTPKQFHYLKTRLHQKDKILAPPLPIDPAKIDPKQLKQLLHKRGLSRLNRALFGQPSDLVWHLAHRLDTGRGNLILKEYQSEEIPKITLALKQQVVELMNFLKSE